MTISKGSVLKDIQECYDKHGYVNRSTLNEDEEFCSGKTVYNKFGSFKKACEEVGVPHNDNPQKKERVDIECLSCGRVREVYPYRAEKEFPNGTSETCKKCMNKKVKVSCSWCGDELTRHNYRVEQSEKSFCDHNCFGKWRSENIVGESHPRYDGGPVLEMGHNWSSIREKVIQRDDESCTNCGMDREKHAERFNRDINVHHIMPRKEFIRAEEKSIDGANEMDNLKTMCIPCHRKEEDN